VGFLACENIKLGFIEEQLANYHPFLLAYGWFFEALKYHMKDGKVPRVVSIFTNFRDAFWHKDKFLDDIEAGTKESVQYNMILEHLNRAIQDALTDILQNMYKYHGSFVASLSNAISKSTNLEANNEELEMRREVIALCKQGYQSARTALMMIRNKKAEIKSPIIAREDFGCNDEADKAYEANKAHHTKVIELLGETFRCYFAANKIAAKIIEVHERGYLEELPDIISSEHT